MKITFLGTGTSHGIPVIGCDCSVCTSQNPKDNRTRSSVLITHNKKNILIDASTDLRQQALRHKLKNINAVLCTHVHADHVFGMDDLRAFNERQNFEAIPYYAQKRDMEELKDIFHHIFEPVPQKGGGLPKIDLKEIKADHPFNLFGLNILPLKIMHGIVPILGYRIENFAYLTDCSEIPEDTLKQLNNLDILVLDALRHKPHPTHFNVEQAVAMAQKIGAKHTYFTHIAHNLDHEKTNKELPENIELAYDGLEVSASPPS
ncbi:MAG: MBL fold metallo-hydrolase [Candidatus Margulisbacteria bacterium]|nr:MBL fold metallo-hydrolase [Candidatus Margulisiibacteriota bacterium]